MMYKAIRNKINRDINATFAYISDIRVYILYIKLLCRGGLGPSTFEKMEPMNEPHADLTG